MENHSQPSRNEQEVRHELQKLLGKQLLLHSEALLDDAMRLESLSVDEARSKGLRFVDLYTQESSTDTPLERSVALLLTPHGRMLYPGEVIPHFYIYFPVIEGEDGGDRRATSDTMIWIEKYAPDGTAARYLVTEDGVAPYTIEHDDADIDHILQEEKSESLEVKDVSELLAGVRSTRLAPIARYPLP